MSKSSQLGLAPLHFIRSSLDRLFGKDAWVNWEHETITESLGVGLDELTRDKISVLQALALDPTLFLNNAMFFLHATDVINNKVADMDFMPMPNSLELAYAIYEGKNLLGDKYIAPKPDGELIDALVYLLIEEGYSKPVYPFTFIPENRLTKGQSPEDTQAKELAIKSYIEYMESL